MSTSLRAAVDSRLGELMVPEMRARLVETRARLHALRREADELRGRIPLWDRLMFFLDTPDEQRLGEVEEGLEQARRDQERLETELEAALAQVDAAFPPFAALRSAERALRLARRLEVEGTLFKGVEGDEELGELLQGLAARALEVWAPGLDPETLFVSLATEGACRRAVSPGAAARVRPHPRLGWEPLDPSELVGPVAERLLGGEFFAEQKRLAELERQQAALEQAHAEAKAAVPVLDTLNVFSDSAAEQQRDRLARELSEVRAAAKRSYETTRRLLHEALAVFPPLAVHQRAVEGLGTLATLTPSTEAFLDPKGQVASRPVVAGRALVFAALRRLLEACRQAFPDVPSDPALAMTPAQETGRPRSPREQLVAEFQERLQAGWAPSVREETLGHAAMRGALDQRLGRVRAQISLFDRLVFFVDTPAEQLEDELEARAAWHRGEAQRLWGDLLDLARHSGGELAPFAARDQVIAARQALDAVHTDGGSSSVPRSCSVYGRNEVLNALDDLRVTLAGRFHLEGTREELLTAIAQHPHVEGEPPPPGPFQPLERDELLRRLALQLQPEGFAERHRELLARRKEQRRVDFEERVVGEKISIWDKINVFTTTPEEAQRDELRTQLGKLSAEITRDMQHLDRLLDAALRRVYPPALPFFAVGGVTSAVLEIRAVCRSYTVTTGTGKSRRTETRYRCDLLGKSAAQAAMSSLGARVVETFGVLPGYNELLEVSELAGIAAALAEARVDAPR